MSLASEKIAGLESTVSNLKASETSLLEKTESLHLDQKVYMYNTNLINIFSNSKFDEVNLL